MQRGLPTVREASARSGSGRPEGVAAKTGIALGDTPQTPGSIRRRRAERLGLRAAAPRKPVGASRGDPGIRQPAPPPRSRLPFSSPIPLDFPSDFIGASPLAGIVPPNSPSLPIPATECNAEPEEFAIGHQSGVKESLSRPRSPVALSVSKLNSLPKSRFPKMVPDFLSNPLRKPLR